VHHHFPHLHILARAFDRVHAYRLLNAGVPDVHREVFASSVDMGESLLVHLGVHPFEAHRAARRFKSHDEVLLQMAALHVDDTQRLIEFAKQGREEIERVFAADVGDSHPSADHAWEAPDRTRE
jgi:voltage-gated potassium channel Kch